MRIDAEGPGPKPSGPAADGTGASLAESRGTRENAGAARSSGVDDKAFVKRVTPAQASAADDVSAAKTKAESTGRALMRLVPEVPPPRQRLRFKLSQGAAAAAVAVVLGGGFMASAQFLGTRPVPVAATAQAAAPVETTASLLHHVEDEVRLLKVSLDAVRSNTDNGRQDDAIRSLKKSVDVLKQDLEGAKAANAGSVAQLGAKLDRLDRDPTPKLAEISARLDRLDHDPTPKLAEITARLDRIEKQVSAQSATGSIAPVSRAAALPVPTPTLPPTPEAKAQPKPVTVEGWMLRDVYGGVALLQGRSGDLREVAPGQFVPGVGEIRSIERRGRSWVVVTNRGIIEADNHW